MDFIKYSTLFITDKKTTYQDFEVTQSYKRYINQTHHFEMKSTSTNPEMYSSDKDSLKDMIQTTWKLMLVISAVLTVLAFSYLGKCIYRQWTSNTLQIRNTDIITSRENNQSESDYERVHYVENGDFQSYQTPTDDSMHTISNVLNQGSGSEKIDLASINISLGSSNDESTHRENVSENHMYENEPDRGLTKPCDLYITPCM